ncbi:MAG: ParB/RepB/Spo0J family partition protein [bacterium]|nr:ParB/RepB/Spo0J family partition protein [bacterium]
MSRSSAKRGLPVRVKMRHDQHFVEELTARSPDESIGRMLPLVQIEPDPNQPRSSMGDLDELMSSIRDKGVLEPILVRAMDGESDRPPRRFRIISGERRFQASKALSQEEIPAIIMDVEEDEALEIALIENLQRKDLTPFEEAEGYRALGDIHGYTQEQIAAAVSQARTSVTESLQLLKMSQRVRGAADALGINSKSLLLGVLKASDSDTEQISLLEGIAASELTREDLRSKARARKPGAKARTQPRKSERPVFTFKDPDRAFSLSVRFRQTEVDKEDLISALEKILDELKTS